MTKPIDLRPDHAAIVQEVLARHLPSGVSVRVFGSRAKWTAKTFSDLDLALKGKEKLPYKVMVELADAFEESDLPFRVDVVDWHAVTPSFQAVIDRDGVALQEERQGSWPLRTLGDLVTLQRGIDLPNQNRKLGNVPIMGSFGITGYHDQARCHGPGVTVGRSGASAGTVCYIGQDYWPLNTCLYVRDFKGNDPRFTFYFLKTFNLAGLNSGSAQPSLNRNYIHPVAARFPDPPEQRAISAVLSALDDKIELNRRMNETLEGMAQAIFRDWFVDFGPVRRKAAGEADAVAIMGGLTPDPARAAQLAALFPDAFGDDGLPVGWQRLHLSDIASQGKGSVNPQGQPETVFEHYSLPAFDKGQEPSMDAGSSIKSNKTPVPLRSILLSKLNPETLRVWLPNDHAGAVQIASTEFLVFIPKLGASRSLLFVLFRDPDFRTLMQGMVTGTSKSHQRISPPALLAQEVIAADVNLFPAFSVLVEPMLERLLASRAENKSLAEIRDYLLPRLMSGTVRVDRESEAA